MFPLTFLNMYQSEHKMADIKFAIPINVSTYKSLSVSLYLVLMSIFKDMHLSMWFLNASYFLWCSINKTVIYSNRERKLAILELLKI